MKLRNKIFWCIIGIIVVGLFLLSRNYSKITNLSYGVSFSRFHSDELQIDWKETYLAIMDDLKVKKLRFSAHWHLTEPEDDKFNFEELDFQIKEAEKRDAKVILAVGRRLPGWPECHIPEWAQELSWEDEKSEILEYIETIINRYKDSPAVEMWQVENEPFLDFFANFACGDTDREFLDQEIEFVKNLDPSRPIIVTDSGEFGRWYNAYKRSDVFGTSMYLYIWSRELDRPLRYPVTPGFFRIKHNLVKLFYKTRPAIVIELSSEPWLLQPIVETSLEIQLNRMGIDKFNEMIEFSSKTGFDTFYFWGVEWWYWMKEQHNHPEFWERAKEIINTPT